MNEFLQMLNLIPPEVVVGIMGVVIVAILAVAITFALES